MIFNIIFVNIDGATTFSGVILLGAYMALDSFTSNWQSALFKEYRMSSLQMMCAVNLFSCLLTATSLFQQGSIAYSLAFMTKVCSEFNYTTFSFKICIY